MMGSVSIVDGPSPAFGNLMNLDIAAKRHKKHKKKFQSF
jgi:hypothetical protein